MSRVVPGSRRSGNAGPIRVEPRDEARTRVSRIPKSRNRQRGEPAQQPKLLRANPAQPICRSTSNAMNTRSQDTWVLCSTSSAAPGESATGGRGDPVPGSSALHRRIPKGRPAALVDHRTLARGRHAPPAVLLPQHSVSFIAHQ